MAKGKMTKEKAGKLSLTRFPPPNCGFADQR